MRVVPLGKYTVEVEEVSPKHGEDPEFIHEVWRSVAASAEMIEVVYADGELWRVEYREDGFLQRKDGPAKVMFHEPGQGVFEEKWLLQGAMHRIDGPAVIRYYPREPGNDEAQAIEKIEYQRNDVRHREDGPAVIEFDPKGKAIRHEFWLNGKEVSPFQLSDEAPSI